MKPCHFLNIFLTVRHLKPYVFLWFALITKRVYLFFPFNLMRSGRGRRSKSLLQNCLSSNKSLRITFLMPMI